MTYPKRNHIYTYKAVLRQSFCFGLLIENELGVDGRIDHGIDGLADQRFSSYIKENNLAFEMLWIDDARKKEYLNLSRSFE